MSSMKIKKILGFLLFWMIGAFLFTRVSYLFRNVTYDRNHVSGISQEDNYDVICIGGSSTFVYWEPFTAWNEYGITSYDLATNCVRAPLLKGYATEAIKYDPELLILDMRSLTGTPGTLTDSEGGVRNATDSLDFSLNRLHTVYDTIQYFDEDESDKLSFYIDIVKYHIKTGVLGSETNWQHINNNYDSSYLGWEFIEAHAFLTDLPQFDTKERAVLSDSDVKVLEELINYLDDCGVQALFVSGPVYMSEAQKKYNNAIKDYVNERGYAYLDTNDYYEEMGLDFYTDFYNTGHVNVYGAEKYTRFLAEYIQENYEIESHTGESGYEQWDGYYEIAHIADVDTKTWIDANIEEKEAAYEQGKSLTKLTDAAEWLSLAQDAHYTVAIATDTCLESDEPVIEKLLEAWSLDASATSEDIRIYSGGASQYSSAAQLETIYDLSIGTGNLTGKGQDVLHVNSGAAAVITVNDEQYTWTKKGIHILVYDNNFNEVLDAVTLYDGKNGEVALEHHIS